MRFELLLKNSDGTTTQHAIGLRTISPDDLPEIPSISTWPTEEAPAHLPETYFGENDVVINDEITVVGEHVIDNTGPDGTPRGSLTIKSVVRGSLVIKGVSHVTVENTNMDGLSIIGAKKVLLGDIATTDLILDAIDEVHINRAYVHGTMEVTAVGNMTYSYIAGGTSKVTTPMRNERELEAVVEEVLVDYRNGSFDFANATVSTASISRRQGVTIDVRHRYDDELLQAKKEEEAKCEAPASDQPEEPKKSIREGIRNGYRHLVSSIRDRWNEIYVPRKSPEEVLGMTEASGAETVSAVDAASNTTDTADTPVVTTSTTDAVNTQEAANQSKDSKGSDGGDDDDTPPTGTDPKGGKKGGNTPKGSASGSNSGSDSTPSSSGNDTGTTAKVESQQSLDSINREEGETPPRSTLIDHKRLARERKREEKVAAPPRESKKLVINKPTRSLASLFNEVRPATKPQQEVVSQVQVQPQVYPQMQHQAQPSLDYAPLPYPQDLHYDTVFPNDQYMQPQSPIMPTDLTYVPDDPSLDHLCVALTTLPPPNSPPVRRPVVPFGMGPEAVYASGVMPAGPKFYTLEQALGLCVEVEDYQTVLRYYKLPYRIEECIMTRILALQLRQLSGNYVPSHDGLGRWVM